MNDNKKLSLRRYWQLLVDYLTPQKRDVFLLAILLMGNIGLQLANPQLVRYFLDTAESSSGIEKLFFAAGIFMGVAVIRQLLGISVIYLGENVAWSATNNLRADLALHCLKLDMSFHKKYKPGELIERIDGDVNQLANFFSQLVVRLGGNLLLVVGVAVLLAVQDWRLGLSITFIAILGLFALDWLNKRTVPRWQEVREAEAQLFGSVEEWVNGTEEVQTNAAQPFIMRRLYEALRLRYQKVLAAMRIQALVADLPFGVFFLAYIAAHLLGNTLFRDGGMTIGQVYLIFFYIDVLKGPLWEILHQIEDLQKASASINRISELRAIEPTILDGPGVKIPSGPLQVAFDNVSFHYDDDVDTTVLQELKFTLKPGTVLGLLGRTGSGKSTLTKLIIRLHDPTNGVIRLGNEIFSSNGKLGLFDLRRMKRSELRQRVGMVTQQVQLFHATVRQNLTLFDDMIPDHRILRVIEEVGLEKWFSELSDGLDTVLEAGGGGLSAGEAQLLAFARVFLSDPGLIILDEASSRLDPATESRIEKAIDKLLSERTAIIVAHRLRTVQRADEIMILDDGQIAEHGLRSELVKDPNSLFYNLLQTGLEGALV